MASKKPGSLYWDMVPYFASLNGPKTTIGVNDYLVGSWELFFVTRHLLILFSFGPSEFTPLEVVLWRRFLTFTHVEVFYMRIYDI